MESRKKPYPVGSAFYRAQKAVPITVYVPQKLKDALDNCRAKDDRSLQWFVQNVLKEFMVAKGYKVE